MKKPRPDAAQATTTQPAPSDTSKYLPALAARVSALRQKRGISRRQLAKAVGIHDTHMGQFLMGRQGVSLEVLARAAEVLGAVLFTEGSDAHLPRLGQIGPDGRLANDFPDLVLPGYVDALPHHAEFAPQEQIFLHAANAFQPDSWVLAQRRTDGTIHFVRCLEIDGNRFLRTPQGDEWRYLTERYKIVARAYGSFKLM